MAATTQDKPEAIMVDDTSHDRDVGAEKAPIVRTIDNVRVLGLSDEDAAFYASFTPEMRKRLVRKVDIRLVPMLAILYLISHLDRANIGNAKIEGMDKDLGLIGSQYNIVLSLFFIPYILLEVPSNILLKRFARPSIYLGILVTSWGVIMTLHGVVTNFGGILAVRMLLGVFEAGFYPGAFYLCTIWYMPKQLATRISYFYCTSALSGAFSGLLAAGIAQMDGIGGYEGWRWIFILEGILTIILGFSCFFLLIDLPPLSTRWLSADEIRFLGLQGFIKQGGNFASDERKFNWHDLKMILLNWRLYMQAYLLLASTICSYGTKFTLPSITKGMGFQNTHAQLMIVPAYVAGGLSSVFFARMSDHFYWRMPFVIIPFMFVTVGYGTVIGLRGDLTGSHIGPGYFAIVLACIGIYPAQPAAGSWAANNIAPFSRRAIGVAFNVCMGNIGGIIGSYIYLEREAPTYLTGFGISLACGVTGVIMGTLLELSYKWGNARKNKLTEEEVMAKYDQAELYRMGDKSPLFKYTL